MLIDRSDVAAGDFDIEFNYDQIVWESGVDTGGGEFDCLGGNTARAGFANGSGTFQEFDGSAVVGGFLDSNSTTGLVKTSLNSSQLGRHIIPVRWGTPILYTPQTSPITVTKTGDTNDGVCGVVDCSLREAIASGDSGEAITIPARTYTLTLGSELAIDKNLALSGAGAANTIIQAAQNPGGVTHRVFNLTSGSVSISGVTIQNGTAAFEGGGILNSGTLTLNNGTVSGNTATGRGGGIAGPNGTLTLNNSTVSGNTVNDSGGGINLLFGMVTLNNSTVSGNTAGDGGGIVNTGLLNLTNSTVSGNTASQGGGGINHALGTLDLNNNGGGINIGGGTVSFKNTIIAGNNATNAGPDCFGTLTSQGYNLIGNNSGCTFSLATGDLVGTPGTPVDPLLGPLQDNGGSTFTHALLAGSPAINSGDDTAAPATDQRGVARPQGAASDIGAYEFEPPPNTAPVATGDAYNINEDGILTTGVVSGVLDNDADADGDPLTAVLATNVTSGDLVLTADGRFSYTPALHFHGTDSFTYTANDGTSNSNVATVTITVNPIVDTLTVNKTGDTKDGFCTAADCSLREATVAASSGDTISVPADTYTLTLGSELTISQNLTLTGAGSGDTIIQASTVAPGSAGEATSRVFNITGGNNVAISDVTIRHGKASGLFPANQGGGIFNSGTLTLSNVTVASNTSAKDGGGILIVGGTATINNSTVSGNTAASDGGGIVNIGTATVTSSTVINNTADRGSGIFNGDPGVVVDLGFLMTLTNSIVSGNNATGSGGGIYNNGTLDVIDTTVKSNTSVQPGGGIHNREGTLTVTRSTVSGNTSNQSGGGGIWNLEGPVTITNSTISGNLATGDGSFNNGGGIYNGGGTSSVTTTNSTIAGNGAVVDGGGLWNGATSLLTMVNTIVANNTLGGDCGGSGFTSLGDNLDSDGTCRPHRDRGHQQR